MGEGRHLGPVTRMGEAAGRARRYAGAERGTAFYVAKSVLAGAAAWVCSSVVIGSGQAVFPPFSALFVVNVAIYRSLLDSARHLVAVLAGEASRTCSPGPGERWITAPKT